MLEHELMRQGRLLLFIGTAPRGHGSARLARPLQVPHCYQLVLPTARKHTCTAANLLRKLPPATAILLRPVGA